MNKDKKQMTCAMSFTIPTNHDANDGVWFIGEDYSTHKVLEKPMLRTEIIRDMDESGTIEGIISVELSELINNDYENFLDLIADKLIGSVCLSNIQYKIAGIRRENHTNEVLLSVSGCAGGLVSRCDTNQYDAALELKRGFLFKDTDNSLDYRITYRALKINEHNDYQISWSSGGGKRPMAEEYYTEIEVKHYISSGAWKVLDVATLLDLLCDKSTTLDCGLIIDDSEMPASFVWDSECSITDYGVEKYKEILLSPYKLHKNGNIEILSDNYKLGEEFVIAAAGFIGIQEHERIFGTSSGAAVCTKPKDDRCEKHETVEDYIL